MTRAMFQVDGRARCETAGCLREVDAVTRLDKKGHPRGGRMVSRHLLGVPPESTPERDLRALLGAGRFCPGSLVELPRSK